MYHLKLKQSIQSEYGNNTDNLCMPFYCDILEPPNIWWQKIKIKLKILKRYLQIVILTALLFLMMLPLLHQ